MLLAVLSFVLVFVISGISFYYLYVNPSFETWQHKSNPTFPPPEKVRDEIRQTAKGISCAVIFPALSLWLSDKGWSQAYCGVEPHGWGYLILTFFLTWIGSDFYEFYYHRLGHTTNWGWLQHKHHHVFYNPTPFAVIADDYVDQMIRAAPLLIFPLIAPWNMDMMYFTFTVFFYGYGTFVHSGYEVNYPDAQHWLINTPFQHYIHHAKSVRHKPYHTGFFFKFWDRMFGSMYPEDFTDAKSCRLRGERSREIYNKTVIPDYSILLNWRFMLMIDENK